MTLSELSERRRAQLLCGGGLSFTTGEFNVRVTSTLTTIHDGIGILYGACQLSKDSDFVDFHVKLDSPISLRRLIRPQVRFLLDGRAPFSPLPFSQAMPMFEWGLNWCVTTHANHYLIVHAAVVEKNGRAAMLPAPPGSGKSTLCAGLVLRGWRLLSDELALICLSSGLIVPMPRPISLKNQSIEIIRSFSTDAVFSPSVKDTMKGTVALMRPPATSVAKEVEACKLRWIVFPQFKVKSRATLTPVTKARAFMRVADNSFNYSVLGHVGFNILADTIASIDAYDFDYGALEDGITWFDQLEASP